MAELLIGALLALTFFNAWMHWEVLAPGNVGWLLDGNDRGITLIGLAAYLSGQPVWPSLHNSLLMAPEGIPVAFTDSNPLAALLLQPFATWLPVDVQFIGIWLLLCAVLQLLFAWLLLRPYAPGPVSAMAGACLLAFMPALINRPGHVNLCAHWLILWVLWTYLDAKRSRQPQHWIAILGLSVLIHPYLLVLTAAFWGSAVLRAMATEKDRASVAARAAIVAGTITAIVVWAGLLTPAIPTLGYGVFGMPLDALWNVGKEGYSALLPPPPPAPGVNDFEGLNYLGAGLLALLVAMPALLIIERRSGQDGIESLRPLLWLIPAFVVLTTVAIGPMVVWRGQIVDVIDIPERLRAALDPVRAAGRLFWPVGYTIAFAAIVVTCRSRAAPFLLAGALALQAIDLKPMLESVREQSANALDRRTYHRTLDPRWKTLIDRATDIQFEPAAIYMDLGLQEEIAWRAITACRPVPLRFFTVSREMEPIRRRLEADAAQLRAGHPAPDRLYIFLQGKVPPPLTARAMIIDGVAVIPPLKPRPPPDCARPN
ncbi:hypothetical protein D1610_04165 [Sphingomonas gilva]|uniref:Glycosyltransferase RgtA/B/C/D-like domain-containing protein n=1 Tax=Sphingomonas gilva TaxID=2305907 RepID=A0A396RRL1_9SPHN|nr:DUF6311 domain-containing protein [Sphingomonas gilva]RHW19307.1 hypothetical protein D1610_04165 [Sphingomonas gilva]